MKKYMIGSKALRFLFLFMGTVIWAGIYLTGFNQIHWLLYLPAVFLIFAGVTGICPGLIFSKLLFKEYKPETSD